MRIAGRLRIKEVTDEIFGRALENADAAMDELVDAAKAKLKAGINPLKPPHTVVRAGKFSSGQVSFTPKTGRNKGEPVSFYTDKRWVGRHDTDIDTLIKTIRRVNKPSSGNVRVYAGNFKAYWAFMIEKGYTDRGGKRHPGLSYLRSPFQLLKTNVVSKIKNGK